MAVIQEAFDIPTDIMTKLLTGEYQRIGGIVRYAVGPNKGQIVNRLISRRQSRCRELEQRHFNLQRTIRRDSS